MSSGPHTVGPGTPTTLAALRLWVQRQITGFATKYNLHIQSISGHDDVNITEPVKEGQGMWWDSETGTWRNRASYTESWPTGLAAGGELNVINTNDIEALTGAGAVIDSYTAPLAPPLAIALGWPTLSEPITAAPGVAGSVVWFSIASTGVLADPPESGGIPVYIGEIKQYAQPPSPSLARQEIFLGVALHNGIAWKEVSNPKVINQAAETLREYLVDVNSLTTIIQGGEVTEQTGFTLNQAAGVLWENNRNWHVDKSDPNREVLPARAPIQFQYVNRDFTYTSGLTPTFDPTIWDNGTPPDAVPGAANTATIQRLYLDAGDNFWVLLGQKTYANFFTAQANLTAYSPITPALLQGSIFLGSAVMEKGKIDWDPDEAVFIPAGNAGSGAGNTPITDHGGLSGLADNDHPQYLLTTGGTMTGRLVITGDSTGLQLAFQTFFPWQSGRTYYAHNFPLKGGGGYSVWSNVVGSGAGRNELRMVPFDDTLGDNAIAFRVSEDGGTRSEPEFSPNGDLTMDGGDLVTTSSNSTANISGRLVLQHEAVPGGGGYAIRATDFFGAGTLNALFINPIDESIADSSVVIRTALVGVPNQFQFTNTGVLQLPQPPTGVDNATRKDYVDGRTKRVSGSFTLNGTTSPTIHSSQNCTITAAADGVVTVNYGSPLAANLNDIMLSASADISNNGALLAQYLIRPTSGSACQIRLFDAAGAQIGTNVTCRFAAYNMKDVI
jgi:hypothetical protein